MKWTQCENHALIDTDDLSVAVSLAFAFGCGKRAANVLGGFWKPPLHFPEVLGYDEDQRKKTD